MTESQKNIEETAQQQVQKGSLAIAFFGLAMATAGGYFRSPELAIVGAAEIFMGTIAFAAAEYAKPEASDVELELESQI